MKRIIWLSFLDETTDTAEDPVHMITKDKKAGIQIDYYIFSDGLCVNTEASQITSIYYILKDPSPDGIVPFIQDIVSFCENVAIKTVTPKIIMDLLPSWQKSLPKEKLLGEIPTHCQGEFTDDIADLKKACFDLSERNDDNVIRYRGAM
jgi:hypothetical protein